MHKVRHFHNSLPEPIRTAISEDSPGANHLTNKKWISKFEKHAYMYFKTIFYKEMSIAAMPH